MFMMRSQVKGFTLIEVLVVVTILAILSGAIMMTVDLNSDARRLQAAVRQLQAVLSLAQEEAILLGEEYGIIFYRDGYRFLRWYEPEKEEEVEALDEADSSEEDASTEGVITDAKPDDIEATEQTAKSGHWELVQGDRFRGVYHFPEAVSFYAEVEDVELDLIEIEDDKQVAVADDESKSESVSTDQGLAPMVYLLSSGENTPFKLELSLIEEEKQVYVITGDLVGNLTVQRPGDA